MSGRRIRLSIVTRTLVLRSTRRLRAFAIIIGMYHPENM